MVKPSTSFESHLERVDLLPKPKKQTKKPTEKKKVKKKSKETVKADSGEVTKIKEPPQKKKKPVKKAEKEEESSSSEDDQAPQKKTDNKQIVATNWHVVKNKLDIITVTMEEISLEGLDGITIEALWTRLKISTGAIIPEDVEIYIWSKLCENPEVKFFNLPVARRNLFVFDRFANMDLESGYVMEPVDVPVDIYSTTPVKTDKIELGACDDYTTRTDVTKDVIGMTLQEVNTIYGNKLVIVASQKLRSKALVTEFVDPCYLLQQLGESQYCILERIGRSRYIGNTTCGKQSLLSLCKDSRTLFYYRRELEQLNIISKQAVVLKTKFNNSTGTLLHLQKFFVEKKRPRRLIIEQIVNLLKQKPHYRIEYEELKQIFGIESWVSFIKRAVKSPELRNIVHTNVNLRYRELYPNAKEDEWKTKSQVGERRIRILQLKDPNIDLNNLYTKEEEPGEDDSDDGTPDKMVYNSPLLNVAYKIIYDCGPKGICLGDLVTRSGLDYYSVRTILRNLSNRKLIENLRLDKGRQRLMHHRASCYANELYQQKQLPSEMEVEDCDEETLSFIADVLHVDKNDKDLLKKSVVKKKLDEEVKPKITMGEYEKLKTIRNNDSMAAEYEAILANNHDFNNIKDDSASTFLMNYPIPNIKLDNINNLLSTTDVDNDKLNVLYTNESISFPRNFLIDCNVHSKESIGNRIGYRNIDKIKQFYPTIKKHIFNGELDYTSPRFKNVLNRGNKLLKSMQRNHVKQAENLKQHLSSDDESDYNDEFDNISINVIFEQETIDLKVLPKKSEIIQALVENFEEVDVKLSKYLLIDEEECKEVINENSVTKKRKAQDDAAAIAKRSKVELTSTTDDNIPEISLDDDIKEVDATNIDGDEENESGITADDIDTAKEIYMGANPVLLSRELEDGIETRIIISTPPESYVNLDVPLKNDKLTDRVISRSTLIIDAVRKDKSINDLSRVHSHIVNSEKLEGYKVTIDRRSLNRIIQRLVQDGFIRVVKIILKLENIFRCRTVLCIPHVDILAIILPTLESFKMTFSIYAKRKSSVLPKYVITDDLKAVGPVKHVPINPKYKLCRAVLKIYGYSPKFPRAKFLHEILYYLIYDYSGELIPKENVRKAVGKTNSRYFTEEVLAEVSDLYKTDISWKMFITPIPKYADYCEGWILIADVLVRLPLSIFVKICSICYIIPELTEYLNHPVRRHILVKNLPSDIQDAIFCNRRYVFIIHEIFVYLCYLGLIQFGPQSMREKDQVFIHLNRNALLYDTVCSEPGYHMISEKQYESLRFNFKSTEALESYWSELWSISSKTRLGLRYSVLGNYITLENIHTKKSLQDSLQANTPESALRKDIGYIPGDGKGAAGVDSAFWVHVKRNWVKKCSNKKMDHNDRGFIENLRQLHMDQIETQPIKLHEEIKKTETINAVARVQREHKKRIKMKPTPKKPIEKLVRKVEPMVRKERSDAIDKDIVASMGKSRARFTAEEDNLLFICKAAIEFLHSKNKRRVPYTAVRDFMHIKLKNSKKTSAAYGRRIIQLGRKSTDLHDKKAATQINLNSDYFTQKYFKIFRERLLKEPVADFEIANAFLYLLYFVHKTYMKPKPSSKIDDSNFELYLDDRNIDRINSLDFSTEDGSAIFQNPISTTDITVDTIQSLIHSSLGCISDRQDWPYMLLKIYKNYSEDLIRNSVNNLRLLQVISGQKNGRHKSVHQNGSILITGISYQLSFAYTFNQITKYPNDIYYESYDVYEKIKLANSSLSIEDFGNGHTLAIYELSLMTPLEFEFELPEDTLVLNPSIADHSELVKELARRYRHLMKGKEAEKISKKDSIETADGTSIETIISRLLKSTVNNETVISGDSEVSKLIENIFNNFPIDDAEKEDELAGRSTVEDNEDVNSEKNDDEKDTDDTTDKQAGDDSGKNDDKLVEETVNVDERKKSKYLDVLPDRRNSNANLYNLAILLTKGLFPELDDDDKLETLNKHFVLKYPNVNVNISDQFQEDYKELEGNFDYDIILDEMESEGIINMEDQGPDDMLKSKFLEDDLIIIESLLEFISDRKDFGATIQECNEIRQGFTSSLNIQTILEQLIKLKVIVRVGNLKRLLVHRDFVEHWTIQINEAKSESKFVSKNLSGYRLKLTPWTKIDGTLHNDTLENWLCAILSHCLSNPFISFQMIAKRFFFLKPVDICYILETLEKLKCICFKSYATFEQCTLFSQSTFIEIVDASYICDLSELYIETFGNAILKFGYFLNRNKSDRVTTFLTTEEQ